MVAVPASNFTDAQWDAINARAAAGESVARLAREFDCDKSAMYRTLCRRYGYEAKKARRGTWPTTVIVPRESGDIGYMAGLIDGEGSLMHRPDGIWILRVNMQSRPTIEWLYQFGGTFRGRKRAKNERSDQYEWMVARQADLELLLPVLLPRLIVKNARARECLADLAAKRP
jgi:hypothetical protein